MSPSATRRLEQIEKELTRHRASYRALSASLAIHLGQPTQNAEHISFLKAAKNAVRRKLARLRRYRAQLLA